MITQDICLYCDLCYGANLSGTSKNMCLNCLEHIVDNSYENINPLNDYDLIFKKDKIKCEMCNQSHSLFIKATLCSKHNKQLEDLYRYYDDDNYYDDREDYYEYEENEEFFGEIKNDIIQMLTPGITYKAFKLKHDDYDFRRCQYLFIYEGNRIISKFIYEGHMLALIFNNKIYTTSRFYKEFRKMYFCKMGDSHSTEHLKLGKLSHEILDINDILKVFMKTLKVTYNQVKNFDYDIKPNYLVAGLIDRFAILNDLLIVIQGDWCECNDCDSYSQVTRFVYDSVEILRVVDSKSTLSVWIQNKIYTNQKDECLHLNSELRDRCGYKDDIKHNYKYLDFSIQYPIEYKSHLEIYKLVVNYPSRFKEKRTWSDITKLNM